MILVTGGTGFIGSHTVVELINSGREVVIFDNLSNSQESVLDAIETITDVRPLFFKVDMDDAGQLASVFDKIGGSIESVIHFAAKKAVGESVQKPLEYYRNNLFSLVNLLEEMGKRKISNLVFSSSCTVYGQPDQFRVTEKTPRKEAESPYGNTKSVCEDIIRDASRAQLLKAISLRYFNPVGAHPSGIIGELPIGIPNNLVPFVTQTAAGIRERLTIFGDDYDTPDGTCIRDYIHVVDLAKAHLAALAYNDQLANESNNQVFNIGTGKGNSVLEVVRTFEKATGIAVPYTVGPRRAGDITQIYADTDLANSTLGWKAELSLEESLSSSWKWEQNHRARKQ